jgi:hypothetical protein
MRILQQLLSFEHKNHAPVAPENASLDSITIEQAILPPPEFNYIRISLDTINSALHSLTQIPACNKAPSTCIFLIACFLFISGVMSIQKSK